MHDKVLLVTGSSGLIGSEVVKYFDNLGWKVAGVDNNQRRRFFGPLGDTRWNQRRLESSCENFTHYEVDIRDRQGIDTLLATIKPGLVVHAAAQPSHDLAAQIPFDDFDTNAVGTLNLLEATRRNSPEAVFVLMSTNKVYGDRPNSIRMREAARRFEIADVEYANGIREDLPIDQSLHSLFGASKVAADVLTQEYGRYFGMRTYCLRGGCLTGPSHSGVELHGFLSYLIRCNLERKEYRVFGYKGKQVRDNIHSIDVARCIEACFSTRLSGAVFNIGGGFENSVSILEAFDLVSAATGVPMIWSYVEQARTGDHICYYSDLSSLKAALRGWDLTRSLEDIVTEIVQGWRSRG